MANPAKQIVVAMLIGSLATACGGTGDAADNTTPANPPPTNNPPTISGTPAQTVAQDENYEFTPSASDPDGDSMTFSIVNQPAWASFDENSGALSGTPTAAHIGTTADVTITVSDGQLSASLTPFNIEVLQPPTGSATVFWDIPTTNADGSPLNDLAGFEVHYGSTSQNYSEITPINDSTASSALIDGLPPGLYFFAVLAVDTTGNKSALSTEVSKDIQP
ncbi:MAG: putative Ig domain-containing protein [Pseudomonadota bacterium]